MIVELQNSCLASGPVQLFCGDIAMIEPQPVDVALCFAVLHHVPDRLRETVTAIRRWLNPGGVFICVEPVTLAPWLDWVSRHVGSRRGRWILASEN